MPPTRQAATRGMVAMARRVRVKVDIPNVIADKDRHGNVRVYFRRKGFAKVRLHSPLNTKEFFEELELAKASAIAKEPRKTEQPPGSLGRLCLDYFESLDFRRLGETTRKRRRALLEDICTGTMGTVRRGSLPFALMLPRHVRELRDEVAERGIEAANGRLKCLRQLFRWAIDTDRATFNPALEVRYLESDSDGFHTWSLEEVRQYQERWPIGTPARLALDVMLYTGTRRSDAVRLGPPMERRRDGLEELHFTETKNAERKVRRRKDGPKRRELPILPVLRSSIDATVTGLRTYLVSRFGRPFSVGGFGNRFAKWCTAAGLPDHCRAHGLRKAGATFAADNGATVHQLMAIFGWDTVKEAERYTKAANRRRLAGGAMHLLQPPEENETGRVVSHLGGAAGVPPKK